MVDFLTRHPGDDSSCEEFSAPPDEIDDPVFRSWRFRAVDLFHILLGFPAFERTVPVFQFRVSDGKFPGFVVALDDYPSPALILLDSLLQLVRQRRIHLGVVVDMRLVLPNVTGMTFVPPFRSPDLFGVGEELVTRLVTTPVVDCLERVKVDGGGQAGIQRGRGARPAS